MLSENVFVNIDLFFLYCSDDLFYMIEFQRLFKLFCRSIIGLK